MPIFLVPILVLVTAYVPGRATARWWFRRTGRPLLAGGLSPFPELLLGLCLWSWVGLLLAELGVFSLPAMAAIVAAYTILLLAAAGGPLGPIERLAWPSAGAGLVIAILVSALYSPPYETMVMASDASTYFNTGLYLARHGSLSVPDPLVGELGLTERMALLPLGWTAGWMRIPGGLLVERAGTLIMWPTYFHLLPVWIATFAGLGGIEAGALTATMFAALALWAVFLFARETDAAVAAAVTTAFLLTNLAETFYGRFLMPEIATQFFLWAGLLAFVAWWRQGSPSAGALAALALGIAGLARVEYLFFPPLALALLVALGIRPPHGIWPFAAVYLALLVHGGAHLFLVPTHYRAALAAQLALLWSELGIVRAAALAAVVAAAMLVGRGGRRAAIVVMLGVGLAAFVLKPRLPPLTPVPWLVEAVPWPVLVAAGGGLALWTWRCMRGEPELAFPLLLFLVMSGTLLYDPRVTPSLLWILRRFLPVAIPFVYLLATTALPWRRAPWLAAAVAAVLLLLNARPTLQLLRLPIFPDQKREVRVLAEQIPPRAAVFFAPDLVDYSIDLPLWLAHERESFVLPAWDWRSALRTAAEALSPRHPLVYVSGGQEPPAADGLEFTPRGEASFLFVLPAEDALDIVKWPLALTLYDVTATRPAPPPAGR